MDCHTLSKASMRIHCPHSEFNLNKTKNVTFSFKLALFLIFFLGIKIENLKKKNQEFSCFSFVRILSNKFFMFPYRCLSDSPSFLSISLSQTLTSVSFMIPLHTHGEQCLQVHFVKILFITEHFFFFFILRSLQCLAVACKLPLSDLKSLP